MSKQMKVADVAKMTRALRRSADLAGGWTALAALLSQGGPRITKQAVHVWQQRGVPVERALQIETALRGAVTRDELRPDLYSGYVRVEEARR